MPTISNTDLFNAIVELKVDVARIEQIGIATKAQAEKTNGRVTKTEEFINAMKAAEAFRKEQQPSVTTQQGDVIVQATAKNLDAKTKLYITMTGVLSVVAAYLVGGAGMIELAALLRLVPYALIVYLAVVKRFRFLGIFAAYLIGVALFNFWASPSNEVRALLSSVGALILLLHALDLRGRR